MRKHWLSHALEIQVPSRCPYCTCCSYPVGSRQSTAAGAWEHSGARVLSTVARWCSVACPIGWGGSCRRSCCTASPSAARIALATAGQPTASLPPRTLTGSSSVPRTVWRGHTDNQLMWFIVNSGTLWRLYSIACQKESCISLEAKKCVLSFGCVLLTLGETSDGTGSGCPWYPCGPEAPGRAGV